MYLPRSPIIRHTLTWSAIDALVTQSVLLTYEYLLTYMMGSEFHGLFGYAVSILYIAEGLTNFGFDSNLAAFSHAIFASWRNTLKFLCGAWMVHVIWVASVAWYLYMFAIGKILGSTLAPAYTAWITVFIIEAIRKTGKHIARYRGYVSHAAITEIIATGGYAVCALAGLWLGICSSLRALLFLHALSACIQTVILATILIHSTSETSDTSNGHVPFSLWWFHVHRIFVGINEVAGTLYTSNFLLPFVAYSRGYEFASIFRLVGNTARWFVVCIQQIFASTGSIVLSYQKRDSIHDRAHTFMQLTHYLHQIVYAGIFFVIINSRWLFMPQDIFYITPSHAISIGFFLCALPIVDSLCAFYLRWYVVEERAYSIALYNIISIFGMDAIVRFLDLGDTITIVAMFAMRALACMMISTWSFYVWGIRPSLRWEKESIIITVIVSLVWLIIHVW